VAVPLIVAPSLLIDLPAVTSPVTNVDEPLSVTPPCAERTSP
jgi:hypothetical protein